MELKTSFDRIEDFIGNESFNNWARDKNGRDRIFWEQWALAHPAKKDILQDALAIVRGIKFKKADMDATRLESALLALNRKIDRKSRIELTSRRKSKTRKIWSLAASVAILLTVGSWYGYNAYNTVTYKTDFGEWQMIDLPDGSTVHLNANSELTYSKNWKRLGTREVWLQGEAFFTVVKMLDIGTEFRVITQDLDVEVLGTSFNVHSRGEQTKVYLEEGKVKLDLGDQVTYMDPGDVISYSSRREKIVDRRRTDPTAVIPSAWNDGVINMKNAYAFDVFEKLEEIYGMTIRVKNEEIYTREYWVQLPMEELGIVIPILERSMKVKITQQGDTLFLE